MSFRRWLSILSLFAVIFLIIFAWGDIRRAWELLGQVQPWVLLLVVPAQLLSYYASGEVIASFLRAKGELKDVTRLEVARFSMEFNFVNHVLPTAGLSGASYATWRFKHMGVSTARAALANVLRLGVVFIAFLILLILSVIALALDGQVNRLMLLFAGSLSTLIVVATLLFIYVVSSVQRSRIAGRQVARFLNNIAWRFVKRKSLINGEKLENFLEEMHHDYVLLQQSPGQLKVPLIWSFVFLLLELSLFAIVFAALGEFINPAALLVAYGFAGFVSAFVATPGGVGAYEAIMVSFLASAGVLQGVAIAGVVLARVILLLITVVTGYIFYQLTLLKYGRKPTDIPKS